MKKVLLMVPVMALLFVTGCGDDEAPVAPFKILNQAGELVAIVGSWTSCEVNGSDSELLVLTFSGSGGTFSNTEYLGSTDCSSGAQTPETGSFSVTNDGDKSVPWDASGTPLGLADPITVTYGTLTLKTSGGDFPLKSVFLVDDGVTPNVLYGKSDSDGGPLDANGFPDDITQDDPLIKM